MLKGRSVETVKTFAVVGVYNPDAKLTCTYVPEEGFVD